MHAARGLQMLAEIAGPQHQDAGSNAGRSGILSWDGPPTASSSSPPQTTSDSRRTNRASPADRFIHHSSHQLHSAGKSAADSHNINGTQMYYGDTQPPPSTTPSSSRHQAKGEMSSALTSVLDHSRDTFPFATIWSSGTAFIEEVLTFFPRPEEFDIICAAFVRHFSAMCPALTIPTAINHAKAFSRMSKEKQSGVSLPWLSVFLMICALGKNCDLESGAGGLDRKVRMFDAFLASAESRAHSRAGSPEPAVGEGGKGGSSQVMVSDLYLSAAYQSLRLCSFLSSPTLQTIHSQLLIGSYLLNTERAASFWPLLGSVARQAQSIGLHVDPSKIKRDWDPIEADTRRRLWWAIVHQDVILSSIFGRPLGITRFSCRFPGGAEGGSMTYATLQCEFSQLARIYLDENQDRSWSQNRIMEFTEQVLSWYTNIPDRYRPDLGRLDLLPFPSLDPPAEPETLQNFSAAGVDVKTKGLMEVHQSGNLAVEVFYIILSLHRSNLSLNLTSLHICAEALRRITRAQTTMIDLLGRARATMFWKIAYYTYQAAIAGAYIVFVKPMGREAESALEDLAALVEFFDRMPERWLGLKMAKKGLRVLRKLAVAARETPEAASMAARGGGEEMGGGVGTPGDVAAGVQQESGDGNATEFTSVNGGFTSEVPAASTPSSYLFASASNTGAVDASLTAFNNQSGFLPPIFGSSSFLSPAPLPPITTPNSSDPSSLFSTSLANVPLVTLFNNAYDHQQHSTSKAFCYDPFLPEPTAVEDSGSDSNRQTASSGSSPNTALSSSHQGTSGGVEKRVEEATGGPTPLNQKDLATYWSEYFSLQLDWDRLTGLA